jgi:hypothetical protein
MEGVDIVSEKLLDKTSEEIASEELNTKKMFQWLQELRPLCEEHMKKHKLDEKEMRYTMTVNKFNNKWDKGEHRFVKESLRFEEHVFVFHVECWNILDGKNVGCKLNDLESKNETTLEFILEKLIPKLYISFNLENMNLFVAYIIGLMQLADKIVKQKVTVNKDGLLEVNPDMLEGDKKKEYDEKEEKRQKRKDMTIEEIAEEAKSLISDLQI